MRKVNKIMMAAVSVLLTLVLITTSILSGVYARFMETDSANINAGFKNSGVTVVVDVDETKMENYGITKSEGSNAALDKKAGRYTVTLSKINIGPGDDLTDLIKFTITGKANVRLKINIDMDIKYSASGFTVPAGIGKLPTKTAFMPMAFTYNTSDSADTRFTACPAWTSFDPVDDDDLEKGFHCDTVEFYMHQALAEGTNKLDFKRTGNWQYYTEPVDGTLSDLSVEKIFNSGDTIKFLRSKSGTTTETNMISFGFKWDFEKIDDTLNYDQISTWLTDNAKGDTLIEELSYTVTVEQVTTGYETPGVTPV